MSKPETTHQEQARTTAEDGETLLQTKRLLVTLKGKYGKQIQQLQRELEREREQIQRMKHLEEENTSLRTQIEKLKEKWNNASLLPPKKQAERDPLAHTIQQQERIIAFLRERAEGEKIAAAHFEQAVIAANEKIKELEEKGIQGKHDTLFSLPPKPSLEPHEELLRLQEKNATLQKQCLAIEEERKNWEETKLSLQQEQEVRSKKWEATITAVQEEKRILQQALEHHDKELEEKETRMKTAQQHLAKKVKENTLLAEELDAFRVEKRELENRIAQYESQHKEMQLLLTRQHEQEVRSQNQWQEALRTLEQQLHRKDEKYFQVFEKYKKLEDRYNSDAKSL